MKNYRGINLQVRAVAYVSGARVETSLQLFWHPLTGLAGCARNVNDSDWGSYDAPASRQVWEDSLASARDEHEHAQKYSLRRHLLSQWIKDATKVIDAFPEPERVPGGFTAPMVTQEERKLALEVDHPKHGGLGPKTKKARRWRKDYRI